MSYCGSILNNNTTPSLMHCTTARPLCTLITTVDILDKTTRSKVMSSIKSKDTKPEMIVRRYLHHHGIRYRLHVNNLPGKPDLVLKKFTAVIFVHGCFWHQHNGCKNSNIPSTNIKFWKSKLSRNIERDKQNISQLLSYEWRVLIIWECSLSTIAKREKTLATALKWLHSTSPSGFLQLE